MFVIGQGASLYDNDDSPDIVYLRTNANEFSYPTSLPVGIKWGKKIKKIKGRGPFSDEKETNPQRTLGRGFFRELMALGGIYSVWLNHARLVKSSLLFNLFVNGRGRVSLYLNRASMKKKKKVHRRAKSFDSSHKASASSPAGSR